MANVVRDTQNFNGETGVTVDISGLGCDRTDYGLILMPTADPGGDIGGIQMSRSANAIIIYNAGDAVTAFVIIVFILVTAPEIYGGLFNVLEIGSSTFNGDSGRSIDISGLGDATYKNPFIMIMNTGENGDIGEVWYSLAENAIVVYNDGDSVDAFSYMVGKH